MENEKNAISKVAKKANMTRKVLKRMEGITLVSLVITIIVMIILAGVSISALMGNEGIFARTANSVDAYKQATERENVYMEDLLNELDKVFNGLEVWPTIADLVKNETLKVGDYIDYDAGVWTQADLDKITASEGNPTLHSTVYDTTTKNQARPVAQGQFGGFELGQSKNSNSVEALASYKPRTSGWRIWDIDDSGKVTLIHAGHPETYYPYGNGPKSEEMLRKRDCSMYVNEKYATNAHFLKGNEAADWYNKYCRTEEEKSAGTLYELEGYNEDLDGDGKGNNSFFTLSEFISTEDCPAIEALENGSYYWFATAYSGSYLYDVHPYGRSVWDRGEVSGVYAGGVRPLVFLKSDIYIDTTNADGSIEKPWKLVE